MKMVGMFAFEVVRDRTAICSVFRLIATVSLIVGGNLTSLAADDFTIEAAEKIEREAWQSVPQILKRIQAPVFPDKQFDIREYGASSDDTVSSQSAIQKAIDACHAAGGGKVIVPAGPFFSDGPLRLKSSVELHLKEGAVLRFGDNPERYTPLVKIRWEGTVCWNWSPLIYAYQQENIAITGSGTIDGNGKQWSADWRKQQKRDKKALRQLGNDEAPEDQRVFGNGFLDQDGDGKDDGFGDGQIHTLRPTLIDFYDCQNVLIEGVTLRSGPFWIVHPTFCKNVTIRQLNIHGGNLWNDDGIDPDSCEGVLIEHCYIETIDDAIAIKAGRDQDAWDRPGSRNIVIRNCELNSKANAFTIGSEMSGGVENVFVENCQLKRGQHGINFKCNLDRGGQVQRIFIRNIEIDSVEDAMFIFRMDYQGYRGNNYPTQFNDFFAGNIHCKQVGGFGFKIVGVESQPIRRLYLHDISIDHETTQSKVKFTEDVLTRAVRMNGKAWEPRVLQ